MYVNAADETLPIEPPSRKGVRPRVTGRELSGERSDVCLLEADRILKLMRIRATGMVSCDHGRMRSMITRRRGFRTNGATR